MKDLLPVLLQMINCIVTKIGQNGGYTFGHIDLIRNNLEYLVKIKPQNQKSEEDLSTMSTQLQ